MYWAEVEKRTEIGSPGVFTSTENAMLAICLSVFCADIILFQVVHAEIDYAGFALTSTVTLFLLVVGLIYRHVRTEGERLAVTLICTGLLVLFSNTGAVLNYLLLGIAGDSIDPMLVKLDAALGFHWPSFVAWMSEFPTFSQYLGWAYNSTLLQVVVVVLLLGFTDRRESLYVMILCLMTSALITIGFWAAFPSFGTTAIYTFPEEITRLINPVVGNEYGEQLRALANNVRPEISPKNVQGLIAMPSYHTIMALITCYAVSGLRYWRYPFFALNVFVLFSIPLHGGHHLVDLLGGIVVSIAVILAVRKFRSTDRTQTEYNLSFVENKKRGTEVPL